MLEHYNLFEQNYWSSIIFYSILFWSIVWLVVVVMLVVYQYSQYRHQAAKRRVEPIVSEVLQKALMSRLDNQNKNVKLADQGINLHNRYDFNAVRNLLKTYFQLLSDDHQTVVVEVFKENKLNRISLKNLRNRFVRTKDILMILSDHTLVREPIPEDLADHLLNSRHTQVLRAIREHLIHIQGIKALPLIFSKIKKLNKLDVVELFESIKLHKIRGEFEFYTYLNVENDQNFNFLLMDLIVYFQEYDAKNTLIELFEKAGDELKEKVVNTMGKSMMFEVEAFLITQYPKQCELVQLEIVKALGRLSLGSAKDFLITVFQDMSLPISFRKHAFRSLYSLGKTSPEIIEQLENNSDGENLQLIRFVKQPLVKYI